jgi:hypothetical protein
LTVPLMTNINSAIRCMRRMAGDGVWAANVFLRNSAL